MAYTEHWQRIGSHPHHGICLPLFSVHTKNSGGIGEFPDLIPILFWMKESGLDVLQLLPLNDTGPQSSPYSALSAFALNPIHLGLASLPHVTDNAQLQNHLKEIQKYNETNRIDYEAIQPLRDFFLKKYFDEYGSEILESEDFSHFVKENSWLEGYALFKSIKSCSLWQSWTNWPEEIKNFTDSSYKELVKKFEVEINYHLFIQYFCFKQLKAVKSYADSLKIFLKGDIPILLDWESADVWLHRSLFILDRTAGAPPDSYSSIGQNWKFPLYNWAEMEKDHYAWWRQRLGVASQFYHIYRIDHIVGFFRIWAIEIGKPATEGCFIPGDPQMALEQGTKLLKMMLDASPMLPIGEDLGSVPPEVRHAMLDLGICGTKVMRWERRWNQDRGFIPINEYQPLSVTTVSTHDSSPLQLWWVENSDEARDYCFSQGWEYKLPLSSEFEWAMLKASHQSSSLFHINLLNEYLALVPDFTGPPADERINLPGTISDKNWSYRIRPSVERFTTDPTLSRFMKELI